LGADGDIRAAEASFWLWPRRYRAVSFFVDGIIIIIIFIIIILIYSGGVRPAEEEDSDEVRGVGAAAGRDSIFGGASKTSN
jgi:hypothetical protein